MAEITCPGEAVGLVVTPPRLAPGPYGDVFYPQRVGAVCPVYGLPSGGLVYTTSLGATGWSFVYQADSLDQVVRAACRGDPGGRRTLVWVEGAKPAPATVLFVGRELRMIRGPVWWREDLGGEIPLALMPDCWFGWYEPLARSLMPASPVAGCINPVAARSWADEFLAELKARVGRSPTQNLTTSHPGLKCDKISLDGKGY